MSAIEFAEEHFEFPERAKSLPLGSPATFALIVERAAAAFRVSVADVLAPNASRGARIAPFAAARHVAMWLAYRKLPNASYPSVGRLFARDYSTVISAAKRVDRAVFDGSDLGRIAMALDAEIRGSE